jgi:hypothetical protein
VISNLGDKSQEVTCPWCRGDGVRIAEIDAQGAWLGEEPAAGSPTGATSSDVTV